MTLLQVDEYVDARGLSCPMPIVRLAQAIRRLAPGAIIELLATDAGSVKDVEAWCRTTGHELVDSTADTGVFRFLIRQK
jgi:TusA-related sulfurtransferase